MKRTLRSSLLTVAVAMIAVAVSASPRSDFDKKIVEQFPITADGDVEVSNKYGNVSVETWSENQVKFEVTITVDARDQGKANEIFERINVKFANTSSLVRATTEISTAKSWKRWMGNNSDKFKISYRVWLPASVSVGLENKYGDIAMSSITGDCRIDLRYGNMSIEDVGGEASIEMAFAKGTFGSAGKTSLDLKYSKLRCNTLGDVNANTKYSTLEAEKTGVLQSNTGYDNYKIKEVSSFTNVGKYDDFDFGCLIDVMDDAAYMSDAYLKDIIVVKELFL